MKKVTEQDKREFRAFCLNATIPQLQEIYHRERQANRRAYARIARALLENLGIYPRA